MTSRDSLAQALGARSTRLERELGRGGFATVFLAQDRRHDRPVALKVLHPEIAASLGADRFKQEIRLAARLQHPHILSVHDSGEANGQLWFTMPFVEGESLQRRLDRERQLSVPDALRVAREVAGALDFAHRHDVIHRDIKPGNILLSDGHALVADFGIARALGAGALTQTGMLIGTPTYMSPEQASGSNIDARTDVYALGCVLYEMLVGEPPFAGPTAAAILTRAMTETPRPIRPRASGGHARGRGHRGPRDRPRARRSVRFGGGVRAGARAGGRRDADDAVARDARDSCASPRSIRVVVAGDARGKSRRQSLVAIAVGAFAWSRYQPVNASTRRLAVLPFENLGAAADDYFADGITDEVRGKLAVLPGLQVTARASAAQYRKAASKGPEQIGRELGVEYLLTGTVPMAGSAGRHPARSRQSRIDSRR